MGIDYIFVAHRRSKTFLHFQKKNDSTGIQVRVEFIFPYRNVFLFSFVMWFDIVQKLKTGGQTI